MPENLPPAAARSRLRRLAGPLVCVLVLAAAVPSLPRGVVNWDNQVKLGLAKSLLRGDGLVLRDTPDDATYVELGRDGRRYSSYPLLAIGLHVVTAEVQLLTGLDAEGVPALLLLSLTAWALVSWGLRSGASVAAAVAGALLACVGTALWPMAALGYDVLAEALALALLLRAAASPGARGGEDGAGASDAWGPWLLAGLALGAAFATRVAAVMLGVPALVAVAMASPRGLAPALRRAAALALGGAPGLALVLWYNAYRFGSPFATHGGSTMSNLGAYANAWGSLRHLEGIAGLLVSPGKGLFWFSPPMLLVAAFLPALLRRHRPELVAVLAYALATLVVIGRYLFWHGDWAWGPRLVAPVFVAAAPVAWLVAERLRGAGAAARGAAVAALVAAVLLQAAPVLGRPVPYHFGLVLEPLAAQGRLATQPVTRPPLPEDYAIQYFEPRHSMIASLAGGLSRAVHLDGFGRAILRVLLVPLAAGALVVAAWLAQRRAAAQVASPGA